jgi:hypothetical protein
MNVIIRKTICITAASFIIGFITGCNKQVGADGSSKGLVSSTNLGTTIGSLAEVVIPEAIPVEGFGLVTELQGTGSAECPPQIRAYLIQHILRQLPSQGALDVEKFINSTDTAVVLVEGIIPRIASQGQTFDLRVTALPGTQTTSLKGGRLFVTELKLPGTFGITTRTLAKAEGPVYIDSISSSEINERTGFILAGGMTLDEHKIILALHNPDFGLTNNIRNFLNGRFGDETAKAIVPGRIELTSPLKYRDQKDRFISIVRATYLDWTPELTEERIKTFVGRLASSQDKYASEIALEAIGRECLGKLRVLLNLSDEQVRLQAARCMLNLDSDEGLDVLRQIALNPNSSNRIEALESIQAASGRGNAALILREFLCDRDFSIRFAAYEQLLKLNEATITREYIAHDFYLDSISKTEQKMIYVYRSGRPRIVLFGAPISCSSNIFIQSAGGDITINSPTGQEYVTIIRKHPQRPNVIAQLRSSFELSDVIRALCEEPPKEGDKKQGGLGVSYTEVVALLKQMCDKGAVKVEFRAGPLPKID